MVLMWIGRHGVMRAICPVHTCPYMASFKVTQMFKTFKDEMPEDGRTILVFWTEAELTEDRITHFGYSGLFSFVNEPFGSKLFRGDCRSAEEATRREATEIKEGKWAYISDLMGVMATPEYAIMVEGSTDETNPWIRQVK